MSQMAHCALRAQLDMQDDDVREEAQRVHRHVKGLPSNDLTHCALQYLEGKMCDYYRWPVDKNNTCETDLGKACLRALVARLDDIARQVTSLRWPHGFPKLLDAAASIRLIRCKHRNKCCDVCHQAERGVMALDLAGPTISSSNVLDDEIVATFDSFVGRYNEMWDPVDPIDGDRSKEIHKFDLGRLCMGDTCISYAVVYWLAKHILFDCMFDTYFDNNDLDYDKIISSATPEAAFLLNVRICELEKIVVHSATQAEDGVHSSSRTAPPIPEIGGDSGFWKRLDSYRAGMAKSATVRCGGISKYLEEVALKTMAQTVNGGMHWDVVSGVSRDSDDSDDSESSSGSESLDVSDDSESSSGDDSLSDSSGDEKPRVVVHEAVGRRRKAIVLDSESEDDTATREQAQVAGRVLRNDKVQHHAGDTLRLREEVQPKIVKKRRHTTGAVSATPASLEVETALYEADKVETDATVDMDVVQRAAIALIVHVCPPLYHKQEFLLLSSVSSVASSLLCVPMRATAISDALCVLADDVCETLLAKKQFELLNHVSKVICDITTAKQGTVRSMTCHAL